MKLIRLSLIITCYLKIQNPSFKKMNERMGEFAYEGKVTTH